jgi:hypothetical protein
VSKRLFSTNPMLRTKTYWHDHADGGFSLETTFDGEPMMTANYEKRQAEIGVMTKHGDGMHHIADIPMHLLYKLKAEGHYEPQDPKQKKLLAWLRDHRDEWMISRGRYW